MATTAAGDNYARYTSGSGRELRHLNAAAFRVPTQAVFAEIVRANPGKQL